MAFGMMIWSLTLIMAKPNSSPVRASVARLCGAAIGPRVGSPKPNSIVIPPLALPLRLCPAPELSRSVALQEAQSQSIHMHPGSYDQSTPSEQTRQHLLGE